MYNTTPLNFAINQENNEEVIKYLLANGANPRLALVDIIEAGNNNALNLLMKVAPSITVDEVFPQVMAMGMRRFFQAVQNKDLSAIKDFI
ncbi:ankyrin repeat family protein [Rickettsia felis str. Pedreira]|uniref:Putative ankyrin repeat protein RF_1157 n=2 Tax=Rickettsia felis TaxID=42862 RepID=Y1157_RICFE|nr:ankyrin repeat domain-containing protein [Rickettsia felis]Q4UJM3.1 RecName: Full=Putative ankyrin repeat protein RF_1157 [Rickettsia felis URRWXCal2]AAY62008.1 unknown [Rickettsia felis URRWXCal2]KHO02768.1 hypothetical protein JS61_06405 [Rickettsia felis]KJV58842.1 ankyrin repeat family protein [Rickettsia felis str. Pedreira]MDE8611407.1 ankyrin repeat domain-containing protein [Rickettsia felis]